MIPKELRTERRWVVWKYQITENGRKTKVPYKPSNVDQKAASIRPEDWSIWAIAHNASSRADGVGFVFTGSAYSGIDLDWKTFPGEGVPPEAWAIIEAAGSYAEVTPSGKGAHVTLRGKLPDGCRNKVRLSEHVELEVYSEGRYFTFTGHNYEGFDTINDGQTYLETLANTLLKASEKAKKTVAPAPRAVNASDADLLNVARNMNDGGKFSRLWSGDTSDYGNDHSRADLALCLRLAWLTGGDIARMDGLFRSSGLMREKWDRNARTGETYGQGTIREALDKWDGSSYESRGEKPLGRQNTALLTREAWAATINDAIFERAQATILGASGHHKTLGSYETLLCYLLTKAQNPENLTIHETHVCLRFGGMKGLIGDINGREPDRRSQLKYLEMVGLIGGMVRLGERNAEIAVAFPLDINALPAYREHLHLTIPSFQRRRAERKDVLGQDSNHVLTTSPDQDTQTPLKILTRASRVGLALTRKPCTLEDLARLTRHRLDTVKAHVVALEQTGFVSQADGVYSISAPYFDLRRTELDFSDAYHKRTLTSIEGSYRFWKIRARARDLSFADKQRCARRAERALKRLQRIESGERISDVMRLA